MAIAKDVLKNLFKKPATLKYPFEKSEIPEDFRGLPVWDMENCIGCGLCSNVCPSSAVEIVGKGLEAEIRHYVDRCLFCGQCAESCPKNAIQMSEEYELAGSDRSRMHIEYGRGFRKKV